MNRLEKLKEKLAEDLSLEDDYGCDSGTACKKCFDAASAEYEKIIAELEHAIKNHHEVWGIGEECFSECSMLCKALQKLEEFRNGK